MTGTTHSISFGTPGARLLMATAVLASGMAFLDSTVVTVALPAIEADLGGGLATLQWVLDSYLLTLGSLVLVGAPWGICWDCGGYSDGGSWASWWRRCCVGWPRPPRR